MNALVAPRFPAPPAPAATHHDVRRRWMTAGLLMLVLLAGLTWKAWLLGGEEQALRAMKPQVKLASVYVTRILEYQSGEVEGFSVGELIRASEGAVDEIEKATMALQASSTATVSDQARVLVYMRECQALLRDVARLSRILLQANAYQAQIARLEDAVGRASGAERRALGAELVTELRDMIALLKDGETTAGSLARHLDTVTVQQGWVRASFGDDSAVPANLLDEARGGVGRSLRPPPPGPDDASPRAPAPWNVPLAYPWSAGANSCTRTNYTR